MRKTLIALSSVLFFAASYSSYSAGPPPMAFPQQAPTVSQITGLFSGDGNYLKKDGTTETPGGTGDVVGPASSTQYKIPLWGAADKTLVDGVAVGTEGMVLRSAGAGANPAWSAYTLALPGAVGAVLYSDGTNWTRSADPAISSINLYGPASQLALGSVSSSSAPADASIVLKNATTDYYITMKSGATAAANQTYTLPTALPTVSGQGLSATDAGVMSWASFGDVTGPASPTAGYLTKWGPSGKALVDGPKIGTFTDAKWCSFSTAGGLACTEDAPAGSGDVTAASTAQTWGDGTGPVVWTFGVTGTDPTISVATGAFTLNTGLALGTNSLTLTGSIGETGARVTKGWFTDAEFTNAPTVGGAAYKPADLAIASQAAGDILYFDGTNWVRLAKDAGKYLKSGASAVSWDTPAGSSLPANSAGYLKNDGAGALSWDTPTGGTGGKVCHTIINPSDADNLLFDIASARTVSKVWGVVVGGTSVVVTLQDAGADGSGSTTIESITATATGASSSSIDSPTLHDGDIVKLDIGTVTGVVTQVMVCYE